MEQIWKNLTDPSWWFTGVFFVLFGVVLTKFVLNLLPAVLRKLSMFIPEFIRKLNRWNEKRILLKIKNNRQKDMKINWLIGRYWALFLFSVIVFGLIFSYFSLAADISILNILKTYKALMLVPAYALLLSVASHKKTLFRIIEANHKLKQRSKRQNIIV